MSLSDRTPGYRNRSHVPPLDARASRMAIDFEGKAVVRRQAAPMPERPAPTMRTSRCSAMMVLPDRCGPADASPVPAVYEQGVDEVNTLSRGCYADRMTTPSAARTTPETSPAPDAATDSAA